MARRVEKEEVRDEQERNGRGEEVSFRMNDAKREDSEKATAFERTSKSEREAME